MPADLNSILQLQVPVIVVIAQRDMPVKDVLNLAPGAILELPKAAQADLEVMVNNKPIGAGRAVKVGENFGVRVTYVGDLRQRIEAMGSGERPLARAVSSEHSRGAHSGGSASVDRSMAAPILATPV
jgi:flagellar motor switch protein FliN/FliY